jgi:hypothetical protein
MGRFIIAARRAAIEGRRGAIAGAMPPRAPGAGMDDKPPITPPFIIFLGFDTEPPFFSFNSTEGSVVIIFTIGLN